MSERERRIEEITDPTGGESMKKFILVVVVLAALTTLITPVAANASTPVGSTGCTLHAYTPAKVQQPDTFTGHGSVDCPNNATISLTVCLTQLLSNGWNVIWWSCDTDNCPGNAYATKCGAIGAYSHWVGLTPGRWYETYDYTTVNGQFTYYQLGPGVQG